MKILAQEKSSKFVHVLRYMETEDFDASNKHEIIILRSISKQ